MRPMKHGSRAPKHKLCCEPLRVTVPEPHREDTITLPDGRTLGWAEYGDPQGRPVLWFHGTPGSRRQVPPDAGPAALERGLRVLSLERPGAGWSTPHRYHAVRDWADDVAVFTEHLGLGRYACIGMSGGGPYALACAHEHPEAVAVVVLLGGLGPTVGREAAPGYTRVLAVLSPLLRAAAGPGSWAIAQVFRAARPHLSVLGPLYARLGPRSDQPVLRDSRMMDVLLDAIDKGLDGDFRAPFYDVVLFSKHWGFEIADIEVPLIIWQGRDDPIVPLRHSSHQAALARTARVVHEPGVGHFAGYAEVASVFDALLEAWR